MLPIQNSRGTSLGAAWTAEAAPHTPWGGQRGEQGLNLGFKSTRSQLVGDDTGLDKSPPPCLCACRSSSVYRGNTAGIAGLG